MRKLLMLPVLVGAAFLAGCTHSVHMVHAGDFSPYKGEKSGKQIEGKAQRRIILGFTGDTNYVERAFEELKSKCPRGRIVGVTSEFTTSHGFLSWDNKVIMKGECVS